MKKSPIKKPSSKAVVKPSIRNVAPNTGKKAMGLYGNAYAYPNYGKFRPRFYTLGDTSQGLDTLSRDLLVRWSREMSSQLPFITAAVTALASFSIGDTYLPVYTGKNTAWWKEAESWLLNEDTCRWQAPVDYPTDGKIYIWDEPTTAWVEPTA